MASTYFPTDYFSYAIYGTTTGGSGTGGTGGSSSVSNNKLMEMLQNIAKGLGDALSANQVRIYANDDFPALPTGVDPIVVEIYPSSIVSKPILSGSAVLSSMKIETRITVRSWQLNKPDLALNVMSITTGFLTGNSYSSTCIASRSRIERMNVHEVSTGVYQISASAIAERLI